MKEIEAKQLLPLILNLASAVNHLRHVSALLAANQKAEVLPLLLQVQEDLEKVLLAAQQFVDQASADDAI